MKPSIIVQVGATLLAGGAYALPHPQGECEQSCQKSSFILSHANELLQLSSLLEKSYRKQ
jgi:hypothetical protein